jgi:RNA-directed DNA polymerase
MGEGDAARRAERSEDCRRVADGIRESTDRERQAPAAAEETIPTEATMILEEVLRRENLLDAHGRILSNGGAPGIDGMTVDALWPYLQQNWTRIREELQNGTYQPSPFRRVEIPKSNGKGMRPLGIPTVPDRFIQQAILQVLTPIFDPHFSEHSYGFRPGRGCHDAVKAAQVHVESGCRHVVDIDLEKFFDRVNHDVLMSRVSRRVKDKRILRLIRQYLTTGVMTGGIVQVSQEGTPQGGPLSPLLSNILLDDLDEELERRGHRFCRCADDCNIYVKSEKAGERVMASITRYLAKRLKLTVNRDKSAVARPHKRSFLGYTMTAHKKPLLKVADRSVERMKNRVREIMKAGRGRALAETFKTLTLLIRGWVAYFRLSQVRGVFEALDKWIRRKLRCILWRQWKWPMTRARKLIGRGIDRARAYISANNGRGPWWHAGASHLSAAVPTQWLEQRGLVSLIQEHRRLTSLA